jgi:hypothetical protein
MPEKPGPGIGVTWNVWAVSGKLLKMSLTCLANSMVWSSVASGAEKTIPKMTPWSSVGAASCFENIQKGKIRSETTKPNMSTTGETLRVAERAFM